MFKVERVKNCPHTRKSTGIVNMSPELISELAAAVQDKDEWAILLTGERKDGGYVIDVTGYFVPPQRRSSGNVEIEEIDLDPDVVGVIHSHHRMSAFFSSVDTSTLNPRFPMSIVIAQSSRQYLGFEYQGTGKVTLPCGATGEIEFKIQPTVGPVVAEIKQVVHQKDDLGDCTKVTDLSSDQFHVQYASACGLQEVAGIKTNAFGRENTLLDVVKKLPRPLPVVITKQPQVNTSVRNSQDKGWLSSLTPDRYKSNLTKLDYAVVNNESIASDMVFCEVCHAYDDFWGWECANCSESEYCMACQVGHAKVLGCPKDSIVSTGA